jgi:hypothetical protein
VSGGDESPAGLVRAPLDRAIEGAAWWALAALALVVIPLVTRGSYYFPPGDGSHRILLAFEALHDLSFLSLDRVLADWWPPGHQVLHVALLRLAGSPSREGATAVVQLASFATVLAGALCFGRVAARACKHTSAGVATLLVLSSALLLEHSLTAMSELQTFALLGLGSLLAVEAVERRSTRLALAAGAVMLIASTFRNEAVVFAFAVGLYLLANLPLRAALGYGALAVLYAGARGAYVLSQVEGADRLMNRNRVHYDFGDTSAMVARMWLGWVRRESTLFTGLLFVALIAVAVFVAAKSAHRRAPRPLLAGAPRAPWAWRSDPALLALAVALTFVAFVVFALVSHRIDDQQRYLITLTPFVTLGVLAGVDRLLQWAASRQQPGLARLGRGGIALAALALFATNAASLVRSARGTDPATVELVSWLNRQRLKGVAYDFLSFRSLQLMAHTAEPGDPGWVWAYPHSPSTVRPRDVAWPRSDAAHRGAAQTAGLHLFLEQARPRYVVIASERFFQGVIARQRLTGFHHRPSYLRSELRRRDDGALELASPYPWGPRRLVLRAAFENAAYVVLENERGGLLAERDRFSAAAWTASGDVTIEPRAARSPSGRGLADRLVLGPGASLSQADHHPIAPGGARAAQVWLWGPEPAALRLAVVPGAGAAPATTEPVRLTPEPTLFRTSTRFDQAQPGARLSLSNPGAVPVAFYAWGATTFDDGAD